MVRRCPDCRGRLGRHKGVYTSVNRINAVIIERVRDGAPPLRPYMCPYHPGWYHMTSNWKTYSGT